MQNTIIEYLHHKVASKHQDVHMHMIQGQSSPRKIHNKYWLPSQFTTSAHSGRSLRLEHPPHATCLPKEPSNQKLEFGASQETKRFQKRF